MDRRRLIATVGLLAIIVYLILRSLSRAATPEPPEGVPAPQPPADATSPAGPR